MKWLDKSSVDRLISFLWIQNNDLRKILACNCVLNSFPNTFVSWSTFILVILQYKFLREEDTPSSPNILGSFNSHESRWIGNKALISIADECNINSHSQFCVCVCMCVSRSVMSDSLWPHMNCSPPGFSVHGDYPGKNTGVGCHFLLQRIFPTQGSNPCLLHLLALAGGFYTTEPPEDPPTGFYR